MTAPEPHVRTELGAYVLGALERDDRHAVEAHLEGCSSCRDELARLSALPPLLDRLSTEEATTDLEDVTADLSDVLRRTVEIEHRRLRRQVATWRAATAVSAAAALLLTVVVWRPWQPAPDRLVAELVAVSADADAVDGTVAAYAWDWGTTVEIRVAELPDRPSYVIWTVAADGHRERAGTWGPTPDGDARVRGASAIHRAQLVRVEVTDEAGAALLAATFDPSAPDDDGPD